MPKIDATTGVIAADEPMTEAEPEPAGQLEGRAAASIGEWEVQRLREGGVMGDAPALDQDERRAGV